MQQTPFGASELGFDEADDSCLQLRQRIDVRQSLLFGPVEYRRNGMPEAFRDGLGCNTPVCDQRANGIS